LGTLQPVERKKERKKDVTYSAGYRQQMIKTAGERENAMALVLLETRDGE